MLNCFCCEKPTTTLATQKAEKKLNTRRLNVPSVSLFFDTRINRHRPQQTQKRLITAPIRNNNGSSSNKNAMLKTTNNNNNNNNKQFVVILPTLPPVKIPVPIVGFVTLAPKKIAAAAPHVSNNNKLQHHPLTHQQNRG
ncbi:hypothetical protein niasHT_032222 [Heterodera trifolii]|uniref:Uncharacterized protein n=1 Tax=Heterodera trifolii TaxID=157864 RepID=A0ABD2HS13_9BILA